MLKLVQANMFFFCRQRKSCLLTYPKSGQFSASSQKIVSDDALIKYMKDYIERLKSEKCGGCGVSVSKHYICVIGFFDSWGRIFIWPRVRGNKVYIEQTAGKTPGLKLCVLRVKDRRKS